MQREKSATGNMKRALRARNYCLPLVQLHHSILLWYIVYTIRFCSATPYMLHSVYMGRRPPFAHIRLALCGIGVAFRGIRRTFSGIYRSFSGIRQKAWSKGLVPQVKTP